MGVYGESIANRRMILLAVLSLIASLLAVGFNAPRAGASGETVNFASGSSTTAAESGTHLVDVVLTTTPPPAADVVVDITDDLTGSADPGIDYTLNTSQLTFPTTSVNNETLQVSISILTDEIDDDGETIDISLDVASGGVNGTTITHTVTIFNDDVAGITVVEGGGDTAVSEPNTQDTYTIVLDSEPTHTVTVALSDQGSDEFNVNASVTFTPGPAGTWDNPQTVTVTAEDDDVVDGAQTGAVAHTVTSSDTTYDGWVIPSVGVDIADDDVAGITIVESGGSTAATEGETDTYTVVLTSEPEASVFVSITDDDQTAVTSPAGATLEFTAANWSDPQEVTIEATDDTIYEANPHLGTITHDVTSTDTNYDEFPLGDITMSITDNDPASVAFTNASSNVQEDGGSHTITVTLDVPGGVNLLTPVVVDITDELTGSAGGGDYDLDTTSVTFGAGSADGATRNVDFTINDDASPEGNETIVVSLNANAPGVNGGQITHTVTIIDDETRNFVITPSGASTVVGEPNGTDTFAVKLTQAPTGTVTVTLTKDAEPGEFNVSPTVLTFDAGNWNTNKTVTVTAVDDDLVDLSKAGDVMLTGAGGGYTGVTGNESVTITDDDEEGATVVQTAGDTRVSEGGPPDTYTIVLDAMPTANVTVNLVYNDDQINVSPSSFTFTPGGWNAPKVFSVTGLADGIEEPATKVETIQHSTVSADTLFNNLPVDPVLVSVTDVDDLQVTIEGPSFGSPGYTSSFMAVQNSGGPDVEYAWKLTDPRGDDIAFGEDPTFTFTPIVGGRHIVRATVDDGVIDVPISFFQFFTVLGDTTGNVFVEDIIWLAEEGITKGCNPPTNDEFCPSDTVTRGQMAAFLVRFLGLTAIDPTIEFDDTAGNIFEQDILRLATAGITRGCNVDGTSFCPRDGVTRGQMAAFLVRAFSLTDNGGGDLFLDDDTSIFEDDIDKLATAKITVGCNPPANDRFCPTLTVTRGQMAAFLHRAEGLLP